MLFLAGTLVIWQGFVASGENSHCQPRKVNPIWKLSWDIKICFSWQCTISLMYVLICFHSLTYHFLHLIFCYCVFLYLLMDSIFDLSICSYWFCPPYIAPMLLIMYDNLYILKIKVKITCYTGCIKCLIHKDPPLPLSLSMTVYFILYLLGAY